MNKKIAIPVAFFALALISQPSLSEMTQVTDRAEISKILSKIPVTDKAMNYRNIEERLANIGMTVNHINIFKISTQKDIETAEDRIGDVSYEIDTSNPSPTIQKYYCDMLGSPSFLKRNGKFFPISKTAVWLMTSKCALPK